MNNELRDIMTHDELHYFQVGSGENTEIELGGVITEMSESSNPIEQTKHYIHQKSGNTNVTGYNNEFAITMDMVMNDKVYDDFYNLFETRATGKDLKRDHYIVKSWKPVEGEANTFEARKITQTVEITEATSPAGEQKQMSGSLKGGDFEYGTFNLSTKTFTADV